MCFRRVLIAALAFVCCMPAVASENNYFRESENLFSSDTNAVVSIDTTIMEFDEVTKYKSKHHVALNRFKDNWFISAGGGFNVYWGDHDRQLKYKNRMGYFTDFGFGKWFSPSIAARFMFSNMEVRGATQNGDYGTGQPAQELPWDGYWLYYQRFHAMYFHLDFMLNLCNAIAGYKDNRIWNCSAYIGAGGVMTFAKKPNKPIGCVIGVLGLQNSIRLTDYLNLDLDIRGGIVPDNFDREYSMTGSSGRLGEGIYSMTLGLTYKFKKRNWDRPTIITRTYGADTDINRLKELESALSQVESEKQAYMDSLALLASRPAERDTVVVKVPTMIAGSETTRIIRDTVTIDGEKQLLVANMLINFEINRTFITRTARVNIGKLVEVVKSSDVPVYVVVTGYADKATGTDKINERLSRERAQNVANCLINEFGLDKDMIKIKSEGGVGTMFYNDDALSRAVIINVIQK